MRLLVFLAARQRQRRASLSCRGGDAPERHRHLAHAASARVELPPAPGSDIVSVVAPPAGGVHHHLAHAASARVELPPAPRSDIVSVVAPPAGGVLYLYLARSTFFDVV